MVRHHSLSSFTSRFRKWKSLIRVQLFATPYSPWNSPGQNTGVGNLSLLQEIFPNQGSNSGLPHCRRILYQLSHQGSPRILEWAAYPFSRGSPQPRNQTGVSCIASGCLTSWATWSERKWKSLSPVWLFVTSWTVACQVPLFIEFSRPEYWGG